MNDTLAVQADEPARFASIVQIRLAEAESTIPNLNERLAALVAVGCIEIDCPAALCRTAGMSGAATGERIVYAPVPVMPGGIGAFRRRGDECAERFHESPPEPAIGDRFVSFNDCPSVVRAMIARHAS